MARRAPARRRSRSATDVDAAEEDTSAGDLLEADDCPPEGRLSTSRLAYQTVGLAAVEFEVDPGNSVNPLVGPSESAGADRVLLDDVDELQHRHWWTLSHGRGRLHFAAGASVNDALDGRCVGCRGHGVAVLRGVPARVLVSGFVGQGRRLFGRALLCRGLTAWRIPATWRRVGQVGRCPADGVQLDGPVLGQERDRCEQVAGVAVPGAVEERVRVGQFGCLAGVHDADSVGPTGNHPDVVGDEDDAHAQTGLEVVQDSENLSLDRDVESGRWLVGDDDFGFAGQRHRDHDALAHAAGELVRVVAKTLGRSRNADQGEDLFGALKCDATAGAAVQTDRFSHLLADGLGGVQRGHAVLENHRDLVAANAPQLPRGEVEKVTAAEVDGSGGDLAAVGQHPHDGEASHRLSRTGLADHTEGLAATYLQVQAAHGLEVAALALEPHGEVADI